MKNAAVKFHAWMERNLEEPFFRAEMARAGMMNKKGIAVKGRYAAMTGLLVIVGLIVVSALK
ncbi:MAG: hypothetical protein ACOY30_01300 [Bacillota bacterium]